VVLRKECGIDAADMMIRLAGLGIATRSFFWPIHRQPALAGLLPVVECPVSDTLAQRGFYIPSGPGLGAEEQEKVIAAVRSACTFLV
jgi:perosamine synthetase